MTDAPIGDRKTSKGYDVTTLSQLQLDAVRHFDLSPTLTSWRTMTPRKRRRLEKKRLRTEDYLQRLMMATRHDKNITKNDAVRLALFGIPIWAVLLRWFMSALAEWAWERLTT